MGQVGLGSTERYLHLTPERFRKDLRKLSPACSRKHWRDDRSLMEFLVSLDSGNNTCLPAAEQVSFAGPMQLRHQAVGANNQAKGGKHTVL